MSVCVCVCVVLNFANAGSFTGRFTKASPLAISGLVTIVFLSTFLSIALDDTERQPRSTHRIDGATFSLEISSSEISLGQ